MFGMQLWQVLLILAFTAYKAFDFFGPQTFMTGWSCVGVGVIVGAILGHPEIGLSIGASLALMSLGVVGLGGASVPNYTLACVVTTIVAIQSGSDYSVGLTIGLPVGMLSVYLDVLIKTIGGGIATKSQSLVDQGQFKKGISMINIMMVLNILQYVLPVAIVIFAGQSVTQLIVNTMPTWLYNGLTVAGKLLPVTGMAILLNYMPVKKHWQYLILGYLCFSYFNIGILPTALVGLVFAAIYYKRESGSKTEKVAGDMEDE